MYMNSEQVKRQREIFKKFGAAADTGFSNYEAVELTADQWEYSDEIAAILGDNGVISTRAVKSAGDMDNHSTHIFLVEHSLYQAFRGTEYIPLLEVSQNKVILNFEHRETHDVIKRKSYRKSLDAVRRKVDPNHINERQYESSLELLDSLSQKVSVVGVEEEGTLYVSGLPQDILTASVNSHDWTSCFAPTGENSLSPYHYARNGNVMVAYFIPDKARNKTITYQGVEIDNKYWRQFFFITSDGNVFASSESYPKASQSLTKAVYELLAERTGGVIEEGHNLYEFEVGYYDSFSRTALIINDYTEHSLISNRSICPITGDELDENQSLLVSYESDLGYCESCQETFHEDEIIYYKDSYGDSVGFCEQCANDFLSMCEFSYEYYNVDEPETYGFLIEQSCSSPVHFGYAEDTFKPVALMVYKDATNFEIVDSGRTFVRTMDSVTQVPKSLLPALDISVMFEPELVLVIDPELL